MNSLILLVRSICAGVLLLCLSLLVGFLADNTNLTTWGGPSISIPATVMIFALALALFVFSFHHHAHE